MITYTLVKETDYEKINSFYNKYNKKNRTIEQFLWEFNNAPAGKAIYVIAKDKNEIIGTQCVIPINFRTGDNKIILTGKSEDTLVNPNYRGKRILNHMYDLLFDECKKAGINAIWGFTTAKKPFEKLGFEIPFGYTQTMYVNKPNQAYKSIISQSKTLSSKDKIKIFLLSYGLKFKNLVTFSSKDIKDYKIIEEKNLNIHSLTSVINNKYKFSQIDHSAEYLNWRIYNNPFYQNVFTYSLYDNNNLLLAVIYTNAFEDGRAFIIETLFHPELSTENISLFINNVTNKLKKQGVAIIRNWSFENNNYAKEELVSYQKEKYFHLKRGSFFVWKALANTDINPKTILLSRIASEGTI